LPDSWRSPLREFLDKTSPVKQKIVLKFLAETLENSEAIEDFYRAHCPIDQKDALLAALEGYDSFKKRFKKVNAKAAEQHQVDLDGFIKSAQWKLLCLYKVMGADAFRFYKRYMAATVQPLLRLLECFTLAEKEQLKCVHELYKKHKKQIFEGKGQQQWEGILHQLSIVLASSKELQNEGESDDGEILVSNCMEKLQACSSLKAMEKILRDTLLKITVSILELSELTVDPDIILEKIQHINLAQLLQARAAMMGNEFQKVFEHMLQADFSEQGIDDFLHNTEQASEIGKKVAKHNQQVAKELSANKIDVKKARSYNKVMRFSEDTGADIVDIKQKFKALWAEICELDEQLQNGKIYAVLNHHTEKKGRLKNLRNQLNQIVKNIKRKGKKKSTAEFDIDQLRFLMDQGLNQSLLKKTKSHIATLKDSSLKDALSNDHIRGFIEHADHLIDHSKELDEILQKTDLKQVTKANSFRIEHWDKNDIRTYLLGNYVGCCLATNNSQFPAMIQRRMDDAMFMHVVIDEKTNLPVALTWLFYAKDVKNPDGGVSIVANFFEIHSRFGLYENKRDLLVNMLMKFTAEHFAPDIGASDFIMQHLSYGHIPDFQQFDSREAELKKVGGFLSLDSEDNSTGEQRYYLSALSNNEFHQYDPAKQKNLTLPAYTIETRSAQRGNASSVKKFPAQTKVSSAGHPNSIFPNHSRRAQITEINNVDPSGLNFDS